MYSMMKIQLFVFLLRYRDLLDFNILKSIWWNIVLSLSSMLLVVAWDHRAVSWANIVLVDVMLIWSLVVESCILPSQVSCEEMHSLHPYEKKLVTKKKLEVWKIDTEVNIANGLTKPLLEQCFGALRIMMGLRQATEQSRAERGAERKSKIKPNYSN